MSGKRPLLHEQVDLIERNVALIASALDDHYATHAKHQAVPGWARGIAYLADTYLTSKRLIAAAATFVTLYGMFYGLFRGVPGV